MALTPDCGKVITKQWIEQNYHGEDELIIPKGYIAIDDYAFRPGYNQQTNNLKRIIIQDGLLEINEAAFYECENLKEVILPDTVRVIEDSAFFACTGLEHIRLSENLYKIKKSAFENCVSLKHIEIPDSVYVIEDDAFENCMNLSDVKLSRQLIAIPYHVFYNCRALIYIDLPESVRVIGHEAFGFTGIQKIDLSHVQELRSCAFDSCYNLKGVNLCDKLEIIPRECFRECAIERIHLPESVKCIDEKAFYKCKSLSFINIPNNIQSLGDEVFDYTQVKKDIPYVRHGDEILKIYAKRVIIPEGITKIDVNAIEASLDFISLPESLETITYINAQEVEVNGTLNIFPERAFAAGTSITFVVDDVIPVKIELENHWLETDSEKTMNEFLSNPTYERFCSISNTDYKIALAVAFGMSENKEYEKFQQYIRKVGTKAIVKIIDDKNYDALSFYTEANKFTLNACETGLKYALEKENHEAKVALMNYKNKIKGYKNDINKQFDL